MMMQEGTGIIRLIGLNFPVSRHVFKTHVRLHEDDGNFSCWPVALFSDDEPGFFTAVTFLAVFA